MPITDELETQVHRTIRKLYKDFPNDPSIAFIVKHTIAGLAKEKRTKFVVNAEEVPKITADDYNGIEPGGC